MQIERFVAFVFASFFDCLFVVFMLFFHKWWEMIPIHWFMLKRWFWKRGTWCGKNFYTPCLLTIVQHLSVCRISCLFSLKTTLIKMSSNDALDIFSPRWVENRKFKHTYVSFYLKGRLKFKWLNIWSHDYLAARRKIF